MVHSLDKSRVVGGKVRARAGLVTNEPGIRWLVGCRCIKCIEPRSSAPEQTQGAKLRASAVECEIVRRDRWPPASRASTHRV